jgi:tetratricopeptide (TPR) repeat protein
VSDQSRVPIEALNSEAVRLCHQGRYGEAIGPAARAHALACEIFGERSADTLFLLRNLADIHSGAREHDRAEELFAGGAEIARVALGPDHPLFLGFLEGMAHTARRTSRFAEAERLYAELIAAQRAETAEDDADLASAVYFLAEVQQARGAYAAAAGSYLEALELYRNRLGEDDPRTLLCANNVAVFYQNVARFDEAELLFRDTMERRVRALGEAHPDTLMSFNNLAGVYNATGRYEEALPLLERALSLARSAHDREDPNIAERLNAVAVVLLQLGRAGDAKARLLEAMSMWKASGRDSTSGCARSLVYLAQIRRDEGKLEEAVVLLEQADSIEAAALDENHPSRARTAAYLGALYRIRRDYDRAEVFLRRALVIRQQGLAEGHPDLAESHRDLARLHLARGEFAEAERLLRRSLGARLKAVGPDHPSLAALHMDLSILYGSKRDFAACESSWLEAERIRCAAEGLTFPPTVELRLSVERCDGDLVATVCLPHKNWLRTEPFPLRLPIPSGMLDELRWYLESYPQHSALPDLPRAERLARRLPDLGGLLLEAVADNHQGLLLWCQFKEQSRCPRTFTIESTDREVLRLPWELLCDPDGHLAEQGVAFRRLLAAPERQASAPGKDAVLRVLMVVARPVAERRPFEEDERAPFIDPRAATRSLLDAVEALDDPRVAIECLYPASLAELRRRLEDHRSPIHVVHFDGHGYSGDRDSLCFEDADGRLELVSGEVLGKVLADARVPLAILDACRSADTDVPDPLTSVAPALVTAGVGTVIAMPYRVRVDATRRFLRGFYGALLECGDPLGAVTHARFPMPAGSMNEAPSDPGHLLQEWFVPVVYQGADASPLAWKLRPAGPGFEAERPRSIGFPSGFQVVGREREVWGLEHLLREHRIVVLHGLRGQGKTSLILEAADWMTRKGMFETACYLSLPPVADAAWLADRLCEQLEVRCSSSSSLDERLAAIRAATDGSRLLLIWDDVENVPIRWVGKELVGQLRELTEMATALTRDDRIRVVLTGSNPQLQVIAKHYCESAGFLGLEGIPRGDVISLAHHTAANRQAPTNEATLFRLHDYASGHVSTLRSLLHRLPTTGGDADLAIEAFERSWVDPEVIAGADASSAALVSALHAVAPHLDRNLPGLAAFSNRCLNYMMPFVGDIDGREWPERRHLYIGELWVRGLVTMEDQLCLPAWLPWSYMLQQDLRRDGMSDLFQGNDTIEIYRFHPALTPFLRRGSRVADQRGLQERYRTAYYGLSIYLNDIKAEHPDLARAIARVEMPNLERTLDLLLDRGDDWEAASLLGHIAAFLHLEGRRAQSRSLLRKVREHVQAARLAGGAGPPLLTEAQVSVESQWAEHLMIDGHVIEAQELFEALLADLDRGSAYDSTFDRVLLLCCLAQCQEAQGRLSECEFALRTGLELLAGSVASEKLIRHQTATIYRELGECLRRQHKHAAAMEHYAVAREQFLALDDSPSVAHLDAMIGTLRLEQGAPEEGREYYLGVLEQAEGLGDVPTMVYALHQLGRCAEEEAQAKPPWDPERIPPLEEADGYFRRSLELNQAAGDLTNVAASANQLGFVAELAGRFADAEHWYRHALELDRQTGNLLHVAQGSNNVGKLLWRVSKDSGWRESAQFAGRDLLREATDLLTGALELYERTQDVGIRHVYLNLSRVAADSGDHGAARAWREKLDAIAGGS